MVSNQQLIQQFTQTLAQAPFSDDERKTWEGVIADLTEEEMREAIRSMQELTAAADEVVEGVERMTTSAPPDPVTLSPSVIRSLTQQQLAVPETYDALRWYLKSLETQGAILEAGQVELALQEIKGKYPGTSSMLEEFIALSRFVMLSALSPKERRDLLEHALLIALRNDFDVLNIIDQWLRTNLFSLTIADDFSIVVTAIRNNNERLGKEDIIRGEGATTPPTIHNWLLEYDVAFPREKARGAIDRGSFLTKDKNVSRLSTEDRALLEKVLRLVDTLLFSGVNQETVAHDVIHAPIRTPAPARRSLPTTPLRPPTETASTALSLSTPPSVIRPAQAPSVVQPLRVARDMEREQKIEEAKRRLRGKGGETITIFLNLIAPPQGGASAGVEDLVAGLYILAEDNALERVITDAKISELFLVFLRSKNQPDLLEGFRLAPAMPKYMSLFLQWVLQEKGKLSEHDAAQEGARLANILKKKHGNEKYSRIAYYDAASGRFWWS